MLKDWRIKYSLIAVAVALIAYFRSGILYIAYTLVAAVFIRTTTTMDFRKDFIQAFKIPSSAMEDALEIGDHILVDMRWYRSRAPQRGEIAIFTLPEEPGINLIKRIVGLPGETVELRGTKLLINGTESPEPYAKYIFGAKRDFPPTVVPDGSVLLFGDNRDQSKDSRYWEDEQGNPKPFLASSRLLGKVMCIYWNSQFHLTRIGLRVE